MYKEIKFNPYSFSDDSVKAFYSHYRQCAKLFGCYYMGYIFEDLKSKSRIGFTTNPDLQSAYIGNNLINFCHLWQQVSNYFEHSSSKNLILQWEMIKPKTSLQKDIVLYREEFGIGEGGISFCSNNGISREYLYFAPEKSETRFMNHVGANFHAIKDLYFEFHTTAVNQIPYQHKHNMADS